MRRKGGSKEGRKKRGREAARKEGEREGGEELKSGTYRKYACICPHM